MKQNSSKLHSLVRVQPVKSSRHFFRHCFVLVLKLMKTLSETNKHFIIVDSI